MLVYFQAKKLRSPQATSELMMSPGYVEEDELLEDEEEKEAALTAALAAAPVAAPVPFEEGGEYLDVPDIPMAAPVSIKTC